MLDYATYGVYIYKELYLKRSGFLWVYLAFSIAEIKDFIFGIVLKFCKIAITLSIA